MPNISAYQKEKKFRILWPSKNIFSSLFFKINVSEIIKIRENSDKV